MVQVSVAIYLKMQVSILLALVCFSLPSDAALPLESSAEVLIGQCPNDQALVSISSDLRSILREKVIPALSCSALGSCAANPAASCKQIAEQRPDALSGDYWIRLCNGTAMQVYCDMNSRCCNSSSGWMRAAFVNMSDPSQECPAGLQLDSLADRRVCAKKVGAGCSSIFFPMFFLPYTRICGRMIAYQEGTTDGFWQYSRDQTITLDNNYIDGYSITVGYPRTHVWSFASSNTEGGAGADSEFSCPCARTDVVTNSIVPPFIGNEYFCESGTSNGWAQHNIFYGDDPLWDGTDCPDNSECCTLNNPPWFCKELENEFRSDIEVRYCGDEGLDNEEVPLELIELFVQ